jgi:hypothetical protein
MTTTGMIVMERGSDWPGPIGDVTNLVAFSQGCDELLRKTQEKLEALQRSKQQVRVAILACNSATDDAAARRRAELARILLVAVASATCGRLILCTGGPASRRQVEALLALAEALAEEFRGTTATVSLRFTEGASSVTRARAIGFADRWSRSG